MIKEALKEDWSTSFKSLQLLFCADRAKHLEDEIGPALEKGMVVICDRYLFSTLAYGFGAGVDSHWLYNVNRDFRLPDLTIFLDISPDISVSRIGSGKEKQGIFEKREALSRVRKAYMNLAKRFRFKIVNGEQSKEEISNEVQQIVEKFLSRR
jgi:dTMP kinase